MMQKAVFLDRDGTIIEDPDFVTAPSQVRLLPGAAKAIKRFRALGFQVVVVSNQSGVARGFITEEELGAIQDRLVELLSAEGALLDGWYYCPFLDSDEAVVDAYRRESDLRKPAPGMLIRAADDLDLDLDQSWMIGDAERDIDAGLAVNCRTVLLHESHAGDADNSGQGIETKADFVAGDLQAAAGIVEESIEKQSARH
jgi:D-glycero-D-manno-heptose 1,7-bisphosphate phosphatase